jgi:hypothetical protein
MDQAIERFLNRLDLPNGISAKVINCKENTNSSLENRFLEQKEKHPLLQLYHGLSNTHDLQSIFNQGFYPGPARNKGIGIYLANHSRYSLLWASPNLPVIICDVIGNPLLMTRHRSEVRSPRKSASEYVIIDPKIIYPKYALTYEVKAKLSDLIQGKSIYVQGGQFGCKKCDTEKAGSLIGIRCDCVLTPTVHPQDIIH